MSGPPKHKVHLTGVQQTLLITLRARALDNSSPSPLLGDPWAQTTLDKIDTPPYDRLDTGLQNTAIILRARAIDSWTNAFLRRHADSQVTVISLACGLDSRSLRLPWGPNVRWIDVDLPDVVELRQKLLPRPHGDYQLIAASVLDDAWLQAVPADRPTFVILEGLVFYLDPEDGQGLLDRLLARFPSGEMVFDAIRPAMLTFQAGFRDVQSAGARFKWAIDDPKGLEVRRAGLELLEVVHPSAQDGFKQVPYWAQLVMTVVDYMPFVKGAGYYLRYKF